MMFQQYIQIKFFVVKKSNVVIIGICQRAQESTGTIFPTSSTADYLSAHKMYTIASLT